MTDWDKVFTEIWKYLNKEDHNPAVLSDMFSMATKAYVKEGGQKETFLDYFNEYQIKSNREYDCEILIDDDGNEFVLQGEEIESNTKEFEPEQYTPPPRKFTARDAILFYNKDDEQNNRTPSSDQWKKRTYNGMFKKGTLYTIRNRERLF